MAEFSGPLLRISPTSRGTLHVGPAEAPLSISLPWVPLGPEPDPLPPPFTRAGVVKGASSMAGEDPTLGIPSEGSGPSAAPEIRHRCAKRD